MLRNLKYVVSNFRQLISRVAEAEVLGRSRSWTIKKTRSGGGGFTRPIPGDGGADQLRRVPVIGRLPTDGTRGTEEKEYGRIWLDTDGPVQGSLARGGKGPVI